MNSPSTSRTNTNTPVSDQVSVVAMLAALLERVDESGAAPDPLQYQQLVQRLGRELQTIEGHPALPALLDTYPVLSDIYENLHYGQAGLCRSGLDAATQAELQAAIVLRRAAQPTVAKGPAH